MGLAIGVDLGGTKIAAGVVDETGNVVAHDRRPTPSLSADDVVDSMVDMRLYEGEAGEGAGGPIRGPA